MSFFKPKFVFLALVCASLAALTASGCSGGAFTTSAGSAGASATGGSGSSGSGNLGTGAGTGVPCGGPEDCDDKDACTTDRCNADGTCDASPKCAGTEKCCAGDCAQCCSNSDCDDGIACTTNTCFSGQCMYVPDDTKCQATQYCSAQTGCRARQACGILPGEDPTKACNDDDTCTTDSCVSNLCQHDFCAQGKLCCDGTSGGCAEECCTDSQCNTGDDPCTVGSCKDGKCTPVKLCADGQQCCPSADGKTATCGSCCSATDCDDKIGCTDDKCGGGVCSHTPNATCGAGLVCNPNPPTSGCEKAPDCSSNGDCHAGACQTNPTCSNGSCHFDGCANGTKCCAGAAGAVSGCALCCSSSECNDNIACTKDSCGANGCTHEPVDSVCAAGQKCDPQLGCIVCKSDMDCDDKLSCTKDVCNQASNSCTHTSTCATGLFCTANGCSQCVADSDCQVISAKIILPGSCSVSKCVSGTCQTTTQNCGDLQQCCPPYGCQINCNLQTQ